MNLPLSPGAAKALALLQAAGYEAWIVGGCVRDALLGLPPKDYDLTTSALPEEIQAVAVLCLLQERKQREAAKILGIGLPLVKYRLRRARELLAQSLGKEALP